MEREEPARYCAFVSYSHHDTGRARALQGQLETYRLPRRLHDAAGPAVARDGRLKPVFRDRDELAASPDVSAAVRDALSQADSLIVVATPASAKSEWVGREITLFRSLHGSDRIIAALFAEQAEDAFHPALRSRRPDGGSTEPLAADFGRHGDGKRLALLKLVAFLAGVPLDALVRRDAQRRRRALAAVASVGVALGLLITVIATLAFVARRQADAERGRGAAMVAELVDQRDALARAGRLDLVLAHDRAALDYFTGRDPATLPAPTRLLAAKLLQGISEDDEGAGDLDGLRDAATRAWNITAGLLAEAPRQPDRIMAHAQSEYWRGLADWRRSDPDGAEKHFQAYAALTARLVASDPRRADWQKEAGDADSDLATFLLQTNGDLARAGPLFARAQARFERAAAIGPWDADVERDLADGFGWLADVERLSGRYPAALADRMSQRRVLLSMRAHDPGDADVETGLIKNELGLARIAALQGHWADAISRLESGHAAALARMAVDPKNADIARQARAFELFEARTWLDMPASARPPLDHVAQRLDGCRKDQGKVGVAETPTFCTLLLVRLDAAQGKRDAAATLLATVPAARGAAALSQRWRIDMTAEREKASQAVNDLK